MVTPGKIELSVVNGKLPSIFDLMSGMTAIRVYDEAYLQRKKSEVCQIASVVLNMRVDQVSSYLDSAGVDLYDYLESDNPKVMTALAKLNRSRLKRYFINCCQRFAVMTEAEVDLFWDFVRKYSRIGKPATSWDEIDITGIDTEFYIEMSLSRRCLEAILLQSQDRELFHRIRKSQLYSRLHSNDIKHHHAPAFRHKQTSSLSFINRYHIFTSEPESDSAIHNSSASAM